MLKIVTDKSQIRKLQRQFYKKLNQCFNEEIHCRIGHQGGSFDVGVNYSTEYNLWIVSMEDQNRFWNGFGQGRPSDRVNNSIIGEINFPFEGINRRVAGAFAQDEFGHIIVLHRGKIGGGKAKVGKRYFLSNYRGDREIAIDGDVKTEFCFVCELNSSFFFDQVQGFINEIHRIKKLGRQTIFYNNALEDFNYTQEHFGKSVTERNEPITRDRIHGIVVNRLAELLEVKGFKIGNDRNRDLFIYKNGKIRVLFEIKTNCSTQCLYAAVGQLHIYSISIQEPVKLIAVLPCKLDDKVYQKFLSLNISILYYDWCDNGDLYFANIDLLDL